MKKKLIYNIKNTDLKYGLYEQGWLRIHFGVKKAEHILDFRLEESKNFLKYDTILRKMLGNKISSELKTETKGCLKILNTRECIGEYEEHYEYLLNLFKETTWNVFSSERWKTLESFFLSKGMFRLALICRKKGQDHLLNRKYHRGDAWRKTLVYLENRKFNDAADEMKHIFFCQENIPKQNIYMLKLYYALLEQNADLDFKYKEADSDTLKFYEEIHNKDITIIGPAVGKELLPESSRRSIIVRPNERGENKDDPEQKKFPTNISYYSGHGVNWLNCDHNVDILKNFMFTVVKYDYDNFCSKNTGIRKALPMDHVLSTGFLQMLPIMVLDLAMAKPKNLYVCRSNLYLSNTPYRKNYQSSEMDLSRFNLWRSFATHNIISQFLLLQNMFIAKRFTADSELEAVLTLNLEDYLYQMEQIYVF